MHQRPLLDDEERQLAAQLARIAPRGEPSAELDARILAMAGRGVAGHAASTQRRRLPRWPAWLGVAASLTAVAGLIWQIHPILSPSAEHVTPAVISSDDYAEADGSQRQPIRYVEPAAEIAPPTPPPPPLPIAREPRSNVQSASAPSVAATPVPNAGQKAAAPAHASSGEAAPAKPASATPISADIAGAPESAGSADLTPSPWPADSARKAATSPTRNKASEAVEAVETAPPLPSSPPAAEPIDASRNRLPPAPAPSPAPAAAVVPSAVTMRGKQTDTREAIEFDQRPPATTADADVQHAWLERIRRLKKAGKLDEARQSLKEFGQRHPETLIPDDLKPLLDKQAP